MSSVRTDTATPYAVPAVYERYTTITRVVDGDTLHLDVDLGCDVHVAMTVRLVGIDTPEMGTDEGRAAKAYVEDWAHTWGPQFVLRTSKDRKEKYGRYLADLIGRADEGSLCQALLREGHARPYL